MTGTRTSLKSTSAKSRPARKSPSARKPYRTLEGWAIGVLLEAGAIRQCDHHGYMRDRADPHAWQHARERARRERLSGTSETAALAAIDDVMRSIGDTCPGCD